MKAQAEAKPAREKRAKQTREKRDIWDSKDVAEHFGCSLPHVTKLIRDQALPCLYLGKLVRFRREDVIAWQNDQVKTQKKGAA